MKFMDKVKNFFTEEVDEEVEPIKKEVIQVEIPAPEEREQTSHVTLSSKKPTIESPKVEEKKAAPIYFDDKDFEDLEKNDKKLEEKSRVSRAKKETYRSSFLKKEEPEIEGYNGKEKRREKFKPSPIISPVYGVLDKNYSKDDIVSKSDTKRVHYTVKSSEVTIDDVRKKAYGTLEDDLEKNLFEDFKEEVVEDSLADDLNLTDDDAVVLEVDDKKDEGIDDFINEGKESDDYFSDEEIESISGASDDKTVDEKLESISNNDEDIDDNDLFNLIDSMYEKKEDE